jgi:hypothetical protein
MADDGRGVAWKEAARELLKGVPKPLGTLMTILLAVVGSLGAILSFISKHWAWGLAFIFGFFALALFLAGVEVVGRVKHLEECLIPRLSLRVPRFPYQWRWASVVAGGQWRVPVVEVVNESASTIQNLQAEIATTDPHEVAIDCPYPLRWFVATGRPMLDVLASLPPDGNAFVAFPPLMGRQLMGDGSPVVSVRVWGEGGSYPQVKAFRFYKWKFNDYPFICEPDEVPEEAANRMAGLLPADAESQE